MATVEARERVRALSERGFDEGERRWLMSADGLLAACRLEVAEGDGHFFDQVAASALWDRLDDESLRTIGPRPSERAAGLICAGRLAQWCLDIHAGPAVGLAQWLETAVGSFSSPPWTAPPGMLDALDPAARNPRARANALVDAARRAGAPGAVLAVADLIRHFLPGTGGPATSGRSVVLILTSRHREGELVQLVVVGRDGPPGIALDPLAGPFTRPDAAFVSAMEDAWRATRAPSLSARWAVHSDRTGVALEVIEGRSVGAGASLALRYLSGTGLPALDPSWAVTGAIDDTGTFGSLLDADRNLATYRTKLVAAGDRVVVVPRCDHPHVAGLVESGGLKARLVPASNVAEIIDATDRDLAGRQAYRHAASLPLVFREPPERRRNFKKRIWAGAALAAVLAGAGAWVLLSPDHKATPPTPTLALPTSALPAPTATPAPPTPASIAFDFDSGFRSDGQGRYITDDSGSRRGYEHTLTGGTVAVVDDPGRGNALRFPPPCSFTGPVCPRTVIDIADVGFLNPGAAPFAYGAYVQFGQGQATPGANIIQKGQATAASSQWKIELAGGGQARCILVAKGTGTVYKAESTVTVTDGAWHQIGCIRTTTALSVEVDTTGPRSVALPQDLVVDSPTEPLRFGGNALNQIANRFSGSLDNVYYRLG